MKLVAVDHRPHIAIEYCASCGFLPRAAWMAQEILSTFRDEVSGLTLTPGSGGVFLVRIDGEVVFSNKDQGRFPETREIRDSVRASLGLKPLPSHRKST